MLFDEFLAQREKTRLVHIHIPKTGGTSVNTFFKDASFFFNAGHSSYDLESRAIGRVRINNSLGERAQIWPIYRNLIAPKDITFAVTRNPFSWLVSYYKHQSSKRFGLFSHSGWQGCNDIYGFRSFSEFIDYFLDATDWHFPPVLRSPIGQIIDAEGEFRADFILATETLSKSSLILADSFGYAPRALPHVNAGPEKLDYRHFYNTRQVDGIFDRFSSFFKLTRYGFESQFVDNEEFIFKPLRPKVGD